MKQVSSSEVTILLPTFNRAAFLVDAIESALKQTCKSVVILIADDACTDDTQNVVAPYVQRGLVRCLRQPQNLGICGNWRESISRVETPYFCILHDDDTFEPEFVEVLVRPLKDDPDLAFAFCDHWVMDSIGHRLSAETETLTRFSGRDVLREGRLDTVFETAVLGQSVPIGAAIFRRDVFTPRLIDDQAGAAIDLYVLYRCARLGRPAYYTPRRLMNYRRHDDNLSGGQTSSSLDGCLFTLNAMAADSGLMRSYRANAGAWRAGILSVKGKRLLRERRPMEARHCFRESLRLRTSLKALAGCVLSYLGPGA
jgi:glycosyltransferase involved in cell wall biosynthesis